MLTTVPDDDLQILCESVLIGIEQWLADHLIELSLPVAAVVLAELRQRRFRVGGEPARRKIPAPRPRGDLIGYLDLVDAHPRRGRIRVDWQKEHDETRARGARYGLKLSKVSDPFVLLSKWNGWIEECDAVGQSINVVSLSAAFGALALANPGRARELADHIAKHELVIGRVTHELLNSLAQDPKNWRLIEAWAQDPSPQIRAFAVRAVPRASQEFSRRIFRQRATDPDEMVRDLVWRGLVYYSAQPLAGWRLNLALQLTEANSSSLELLDQVLGMLRQQAVQSGTKPTLTTGQKAAVRRIILTSATTDQVPRNHRLSMALEEVQLLGLDLVLPWLREHLDHVRIGGAARFVQPLPDELQPHVHSRGGTAGGRRELERLLDELEKTTTTGLYRMAVEEAVSWLGSDSAAVTRRIGRWAIGGKRERQLAHRYVHSGNWRIFTSRARLLLAARPDDPDVHASLIAPRYPRVFMGSLEPHYQACANQYRRWYEHRDRRLRALGIQAVEQYERLAEEAAERERRERETI
jgi:hypothetical protein